MKQFLSRVMILAFTALSLANCKFTAEGTFVQEGDGDPVLVSAKSSSISYSHGGWYPGPGRANYELVMDLKVTDQNNVRVVAQTPEKRISRTISIRKYVELENLLLDARTVIPTSGSVDRGDELVTMKLNHTDHYYFLREGDFIFAGNKMAEYEQKRGLVVKEDAEKIADKIDEIFNLVSQ